jgi:DNA uptake protein ComE-like DNA-binding protein
VVHRLASSSYIEAGFQPRKLNINTADERELAAHPYLRKTVAKSIVAYRFQHGKFESLEDLRNIHTLEPETIKKIVPYLTTGD